jgi:putative copper export protein
VLALLNVATGWLLFASLAVMLGCALGRWTVLPRPSVAPRVAPSAASSVDVEALRRAAARLGRRGAVGLLLALGLVFLRQLLEFRDPFVPWTEDAGLLLRGTPWGTAWLLAVTAAVAVTVAFQVAARGHTRAWWPVTILALSLGAYPAFTGHANTGDLRGLTLVADIFHVWAVGGWIGGLGLVVLLDRGHRRGSSGAGPSILPLLVSRFSPMAVACVATLVVTGTFASWVHLNAVGDLIGTAYGRLLLLKVLLACVVFGLGAWNYRRLTPTLGEPTGWAAMRRSATVEFLVANLVLLVTAMLVRTSPM